jgi:hypothetical protein
MEVPFHDIPCIPFHPTLFEIFWNDPKPKAWTWTQENEPKKYAANPGHGPIAMWAAKLSSVFVLTMGTHSKFRWKSENPIFIPIVPLKQL